MTADAWCAHYAMRAPTMAPSSHRWLTAGIEPQAKGWSTRFWQAQVVVGLALLLVLVVLLLPVMLLLTSLEAMRELLRLNGRNEHPDAEESGVTLVLPGTCSYIFWQLGMIQYLCEHFDTRSAKLAGVSSGAVSAVMLLHMEEIAQKAAAAEKDSENAGLAAAAAARQRAQEVFEIIEGKTAELMRTPLSFFGRLGQLMEDLAPRVLPEGDAIALGSRLQIGVRRLATGVVPALVPDVVGSFTSRDELLDGVLASCNVWLVVRLHPCRFLPSLSAFCSDGVNPYSLYCFWDYLCQRLTGQAEISAPHEMHGGILDRIYAIWNCTVMKVLLPSSGKRLWVSPTVGGRLNVMYLLRFSGWFIGEQWQQGYAHARDLDARGYWQALPRRPGM